jgi:L-threonylcarbamoyladenylate synthase
LKGRPETSALTLIGADVVQARAAADLGATAARLAEHWWPGPLTIVMTAGPLLAPAVLAGGTTVGIRVPDHAVAIALARDVGFCVTATSANRSGSAAAATPAAVLAALPDVDAILDAGPSHGGAPSTIVNATGHDVALIRAGAVPWDRVLRSLH